MFTARLALAATLALSSSFAFARTAESHKPHVLMISVDGMKPEYVTHAAAHGIKVPTLASFVKDGTYADGVIGVLPTVTYSSHTSLVTGVTPREHGIVNNTPFDPLGQHPGEWYWYFNELKSETLYQAASKVGLKTGAVSWPVTVGAPIDYLVAVDGQSEVTDTPGGKMVKPDSLQSELNINLHYSKQEGDEAMLRRDANATEYTVGIIEKHKPEFMLSHVSNLDHQEHAHGPFSPEANAAIERIDGQVAQMIAAERKVYPDAKIIIVSDHGFTHVEKNVNINAALVKAGLLHIRAGKLPKGTSRIESWEATAWHCGGVSYIVVRDPKDAALVKKTRAALDALAADPANGIDRILTHEEIMKRGGADEASFLVAFKPGWSEGPAYTGDVLVDKGHIGWHGHLSDFPDLRSSFFAEGPGIAKGKDLGVINMLQVAPSVAEMLHAKLPAAKAKPLALK